MSMTGGGFKPFLFSPLVGEDSLFDDHIFQRGGEKPPASVLMKPFLRKT